jgi:hypothetical protein
VQSPIPKELKIRFELQEATSCTILCADSV